MPESMSRNLSRLVLASGNAGKRNEIQALLAPLGIELITQSDLGIADAEEIHSTFLENALLKARHASALSGLPALADDSGLCVAALDGAPGVRSARFAADAGAPVGDRAANDARNNTHLVARLAGQSRAAWYVCVLVLVRGPVDPHPIVADAIWSGQIIDEPRGSHGFGYDAHFLLPELGLTAAQLEPSRKNALSHRGQAMGELLSKLRRLPEARHDAVTS
jgi:XTP/dITP diphosphohydrolase